jgi:hypothetical protein
MTQPPKTVQVKVIRNGSLSVTGIYDYGGDHQFWFVGTWPTPSAMINEVQGWVGPLGVTVLEV